MKITDVEVNHIVGTNNKALMIKVFEKDNTHRMYFSYVTLFAIKSLDKKGILHTQLYLDPSQCTQTTKKHIEITLGISFKTYKEMWLRQIEDRK